MQKRSVFLVLALLLAMAAAMLTGCGKEEGNNRTGFVYVPQYLQIEGLTEAPSTIFFDGEQTLYLNAYGVIGERVPTEEELELYASYGEDTSWLYEEYGPILYTCNIDGSNLTKLEGYKPGGDIELAEGTYTNLNSMQLDAEGNLWVLEYAYLFLYDDQGEWLGEENRYFLRQLDAEGNQVQMIELVGLDEGQEYFYINGFAIDAEDNIYVAGPYSVYILDMTGQVQFSIGEGSDTWIDGIFTTNSGTVYTRSYGENGYELRPLDVARQQYGTDKIVLGYNAYQIYPGVGNYEIYYINGSDLYAYNSATKKTEKVLNFIDSDIDSGMMSTLIPISDTEILVTSYSYDNTTGASSGAELVRLTKTPASEVKQKTIISMATMYLDYSLRTRIIQFNKTNPDYRIQVQEYNQYNTSEDWTAGLNKLNTEIISGAVPDIIVTSQLPIQQYAGKGVLEDLWPYIDADQELGGRDALVPAAMTAMETNGKLYQVFPSFYVISMVGAADVVGTEMGWTMADMVQVLKEHPDAAAFAYASQSQVLYYMLMLSQDDYIDWTTGECSFDTPEFTQLLEFVKSFPAEIDWSNWEEMPDEYQLLRENKVLFQFASLYDFKEIKTYKMIFGRDVTFIGFPTSSGVGNRISSSNGLAMSAKSKHKDAVWSFISEVLTEDYQRNSIWWEFPTNQKLFDERLAEAMKENPNVSGGYTTFYGDGMEFDSSTPLTQQEADQLMAVINSAKGGLSYDEQIMTLVTEETAAFFAGDKTAAETAALIQSRMNIYVNEKR